MARFRFVVCAAPLVFTAATAGAQARQPYSVQASALFTVQKFADESVGGTGIELQGRYNPGRYSFGLGVQYSSHTSGEQSIDLAGLFFEPRFAVDIGNDRLTPYLAGRAAVLRHTSDFVSIPEFSGVGTAFGLGGGVLAHLTPRVNFDLGAAYIRQSFPDKTFDTGAEVRFTPFNGYVAKAGFTLGLGSRS